MVETGICCFAHGVVVVIVVVGTVVDGNFYLTFVGREQESVEHSVPADYEFTWFDVGPKSVEQEIESPTFRWLLTLNFKHRECRDFVNNLLKKVWLTIGSIIGRFKLTNDLL